MPIPALCPRPAMPAGCLRTMNLTPMLNRLHCSATQSRNTPRGVERAPVHALGDCYIHSHFRPHSRSCQRRQYWRFRQKWEVSGVSETDKERNKAGEIVSLCLYRIRSWFSRNHPAAAVLSHILKRWVVLRGGNRDDV
jgi:hypothetical protein